MKQVLLLSSWRNASRQWLPVAASPVQSTLLECADAGDGGAWVLGMALIDNDSSKYVRERDMTQC